MTPAVIGAIAAKHRITGTAPTVAPAWDPITVASPLVLSVSNARVTLPVSNSGIAKTVRGTRAVTAGKWYWEVLVTSAIPGSATTTGAIGIVDSVFPYATTNLAGGSTANSGALWLSGNVYFSASIVLGTALTLSPGDIAMAALDIGAGKIWFGKNGAMLGDPVVGTGAAWTGLSTSATYYPAATPWSSDATNPVVLDIKGVTNSSYTAPTGFTPYGL